MQLLHVGDSRQQRCAQAAGDVGNIPGSLKAAGSQAAQHGRRVAVTSNGHRHTRAGGLKENRWCGASGRSSNDQLIHARREIKDGVAPPGGVVVLDDKAIGAEAAVQLIVAMTR